jgi:hypothetical protein
MTAHRTLLCVCLSMGTHPQSYTADYSWGISTNLPWSYYIKCRGYIHGFCVLCFEAPPRVLYAELQGLWLRIWHTKFWRLCHWYGTLHYGGLWPHLLCIEFWTLHNKLGILIYGGNNHKLTYWIVELHKWLYPKEANSLRNRAHLANKQRSLTDYLRESHFLSSHRRLLSFTSSWSSSSSTHLTPQEASDLLCCLILTASTHTQD